jgi:hypothetical protein
MEEFKGTRLTLEIDGEKAVWESPANDHNVEDILQALRGLMIAHTFLDISFVNVCGALHDENIELYEKEKEDD